MYVNITNELLLKNAINEVIFEERNNERSVLVNQTLKKSVFRDMMWFIEQ